MIHPVPVKKNMSNNPLLSIITVNLNDVEGLSMTMTSIFKQSWQEFEYIIIDGGSTDGSKEYIEKFNDRIDTWVSEKDTGIYNAMNKGIKAATGKYLLFLNSGDWLYNNTVLSYISENLKGEEDFIYGDIIKIFKGGTEVVEKGSNNITLKTFLEGSINHQALFVNKKVFELFGLYDEKYSIVSDWKLNLLALGLNDSSLKYVNQTISFYPLNGLSMDFALRDKERKQVIEDLIPDSVLKDYELHINKKNEPESNRYKMFMAMEENKLARKFNSGLFRILLAVFTGKTLKELD